MRNLVLLCILVCAAEAGQGGVVRGVLRDEKGKPWNFKTVQLADVTAERPNFLFTRTDDEGRFVFPKVPAGTYVIDHEHGAYDVVISLGREFLKGLQIRAEDARTTAERRLQAALRLAFEDHPRRLEIRDGEVEDVEFTLPRPPRFSGEAKLTVTLSGAGPVESAKVALGVLDPRYGRIMDIVGGDEKAPDSGGRTRFGSLRAGLYVPVVTCRGWELQCGVHEIHGGTSPNLSLRLGTRSLAIEATTARGDAATEATIFMLGPLGEPFRTISSFAGKPHAQQDGVHAVPFLKDGVYVGVVESSTSISTVWSVRISPENPKPELAVELPPLGGVLVALDYGESGRRPFLAVRAVNEAGQEGGVDVIAPGEDGRIAFLEKGTWRVGLQDPSSKTKFWGTPKRVTVKPYELTKVTLRVPDR